MEGITNFLKALSTIIWPLLILILVFYFRKEIRHSLGNVTSIEAGNVKVKLGEDENTSLGLNELAKKLDSQIEALERDVHKLQSKVITDREAEMQLPEPPESNAVLWVDDIRNNNANMIARLESNKYKIDDARSTAEGLKKFDKKRNPPYRFIISDLGRTEDNIYDERAGIDLLKTIKQRQPDVLVVIFSWSDKMSIYRNEIKQLGGIPITSTMELQAFFDRYAPPRQ